MAKLISSIETIVKAEYWKPEDIANPKTDLEKSIRMDYPDGSSDGQANKLFQEKRFLTAQQIDALDLDGTLDDDFGDPLALTRLCSLFVEADISNTEDIRLSSSISGLFGGAAEYVEIKPGGVVSMSSPNTAYTVISTDSITVTNPSATASAIYRIIFLGS